MRLYSRAGFGGVGQPGKFYRGAAEALTAYAKDVCYQSVFGSDVELASKQIDRLPPAMRAKFASVSTRREVPLPPSRFGHIWAWFLELTESRCEGMGGPAPITYLDILAWVMLTGAAPRPIECRLLIAIDNAWRAEWHRLQALKNPPAAP